MGITIYAALEKMLYEGLSYAEAKALTGLEDVAFREAIAKVAADKSLNETLRSVATEAMKRTAVAPAAEASAARFVGTEAVKQVGKRTAMGLFGWGVAIAVVSAVVLYGAYSYWHSNDSSKTVPLPIPSPTGSTPAQQVSRTCTRGQQPIFGEHGSALSLNFYSPTYTLKYTDPATQATNTIQWTIPPENITTGQEIILVSSSTRTAGAPIYAQWEVGSGQWANAADAEQVQQTSKENKFRYTGGPIKLVVKKRGGGNESRFDMQWNYTCQ